MCIRTLLIAFWLPISVLSVLAGPTLSMTGSGAPDGPEAESPWMIECVHCVQNFENMTDRSFRQDPDGHPHIAYGSDHLYHAWHNGSEWEISVVDESPGVGTYAALAISSSGERHISYYDQAHNDLKYARWNGQEWEIATLDGDGYVGMFTSIALHPENDYPYISYGDYTNGKLKLARWNGEGWVIAPIADSAYGGDSTSIAFDTSALPGISFYDNGTLKYAFDDGMGWNVQPVDSSTGVGSDNSLAFEDGIYPAISYYDGANGALKFAYRDAAMHWTRYTVDNSANQTGQETSLAIDENGIPHISYLDQTNGDLKYATTENTVWISSTLDSDGDTGAYSSLYLDDDGRPNISYMNKGTGELTHIRRTATDWPSSVIDHGLSLYGGTIALAPDGAPHLGYRDQTMFAPRHAFKGAGGWELSDPLDRGDSCGGRPSLAVDDQGHASMSYFHYDDREIRYGSNNGPGWQFETVSGSHANAFEPTLALDPAQEPKIGVGGDTIGAHLYYKDGATWKYHTVDAGTNEPGGISLVIHDNGDAHLSYHDGWNWSVRYTVWDGSSGQTRTLSDTIRTLNTWLALSDDGYPHIVYDPQGSKLIAYAHRDEQQWYEGFVEPNGESQAVGNLVLDASGYPHMVYVNDSSTSLAYLYQNDDGWHEETIFQGMGDDWGVGQAQLAMDAVGNRHVSFSEGWLDDLMYAYRANNPPVAIPAEIPPVEPGEVAVLNGSGSHDPDGNLPLAFSWTQTGGNPVALSDSEAEEVTFTAPDDPGPLTFSLTVTDSLGMPSEPATLIMEVRQGWWVYLPMVIR